mmetsp:Transcript_25101/g.79208  ORF Transcript_25101/g.79208 Transcript_25101/m.79208 type:complete len:210 (+) Transcript_25101:2168-2797(+)
MHHTHQRGAAGHMLDHRPIAPHSTATAGTVTSGTQHQGHAHPNTDAATPGARRVAHTRGSAGHGRTNKRKHRFRKLAPAPAHATAPAAAAADAARAAESSLVRLFHSQRDEHLHHHRRRRRRPHGKSPRGKNRARPLAYPHERAHGRHPGRRAPAVDAQAERQGRPNGSRRPRHGRLHFSARCRRATARAADAHGAEQEHDAAATVAPD